MNISEANAMFQLLDWLGATRPMDPVTDGDVAEAWFLLAERAGKALEVPVTTRQVWEAFEAFSERLRGTAEAEAVCEAIAASSGGDVIITGEGGDVIATLSGLTAAFARWNAAHRELMP